MIDRPNIERPQLDESVRKIAILPGGDAALITGKGLAVVGTEREIDITDMPPAEREQVRKNLHQLKITQKGDNISIRAGAKTFSVQDKHFKGRNR